jgi:hypothetical protein
MFNFSEWVVSGIIDGYKTGITPFARVAEMTTNYLLKGIITQEQADKIALECPAPLGEGSVNDE